MPAGAARGSTAELYSLSVLSVDLQCLGLRLVSKLQRVCHFCICQVESSWARPDEGSAGHMHTEEQASTRWRRSGAGAVHHEAGSQHGQHHRPDRPQP